MLVHAGAAKSEVVNFTDGTWQVRVAAPPVKGKANKELIAFLSKVLGVSKTRVTIVNGFATRRKVLTIDGLSQEEISKRLSLSVKPPSAGDAKNRLSRQQLSRRG